MTKIRRRGRQSYHTFSIGDDVYYALKEISTLRGDAHVAPLALEIFENYIQQHKKDLPKD